MLSPKTSTNKTTIRTNTQKVFIYRNFSTSSYVVTFLVAKNQKVDHVVQFHYLEFLCEGYSIYLCCCYLCFFCDDRCIKNKQYNA